MIDNVGDCGEVVNHCLLHEQSSLAQQKLQELYTPPPRSYDTLDNTVATPPPAQVPITPTSDQSVLTDQFSEMENSMQRRENDLQNREQNMMTKMQDMMARMLSQNTDNNTSNNNRTQSNNNRSSSRGGRGGRNSYSGDCTSSTRTSSAHKYCWTHGACAHSGNKCNTKSDGHQAQATFTNMFDGSTNNCYWLPT